MGNCKDCRWWSIDYAFVCSFVYTTSAANTENGVSIVSGDSGEGGGYLMTQAMFGCVHFAAKDSADEEEE